MILSPTRATVAYPTDKNFEDAYPGVGGGPPLIPAANLCGLPALCMPNGFGENGLPTSIAAIGPAFFRERSRRARQRIPGQDGLAHPAAAGNVDPLPKEES